MYASIDVEKYSYQKSWKSQYSLWSPWSALKITKDCSHNFFFFQNMKCILCNNASDETQTQLSLQILDISSLHSLASANRPYW